MSCRAFNELFGYQNNNYQIYLFPLGYKNSIYPVIAFYELYYNIISTFDLESYNFFLENFYFVFAVHLKLSLESFNRNFM